MWGQRGESLTSTPNSTPDCPNHSLVAILTVLSWLPPELGFQVQPANVHQQVIYSQLSNAVLKSAMCCCRARFQEVQVCGASCAW